MDMDDYWGLLREIEESIKTREYANLSALLFALQESTVPFQNPSVINPTVNLMRGCFSDLHTDILLNREMNTGNLIEAFSSVPFYRSPLPLMSGLALMTKVACLISSNIDRIGHKARNVNPDVLEICDDYISEYDSSGSDNDAYVCATKGIIRYIKDDHDAAFQNFEEAEGYFYNKQDLTPRDYLMWAYRGICNTLSEQTILAHLATRTDNFCPSGFLLAENPGRFVSFAAADSVYFEAFAGNLCRSFFCGPTEGSLHIHVVLSSGTALREILQWRKAQPAPIIARFGVSWSFLPGSFLIELANDARDTQTSYFTMVRYFFLPWVMARYQKPLFVHDIDLTFTSGLDESLAWCESERITVGHHGHIGFLSCMPWFDKQAICTFIANSNLGRFYARSLSKVGWVHFSGPRPIRYNIDQNLISSLTRFCLHHLGDFRSADYNFHVSHPWIDTRLDPAMKGVRERIG